MVLLFTSNNCVINKFEPSSVSSWRKRSKFSFKPRLVRNGPYQYVALGVLFRF